MKSNNFFLNKNRNISAYWKIQIFGWLLTSLYWSLIALLDGDFLWDLGIADLVLDVLIGIGLTHIYRNFALSYRWVRLDLKRLIPRIIIAVFILSFLYMLLIISKLYLARFFLLESSPVSFIELFNSLRLQVFITGTRLMTIWVLAYHLFHYSKREIEIIKKNAQLSLAVKDAQMNKLTAQLNPHFFFNSLNNIKFLVLENPKSARRAIDLLSDLLRTSLNKNQEALIPLSEEIDLVKDYLELEKMRFEQRLQVGIEILPTMDLSNYSIPPLCIQPLVENAIKHGIAKRKKGGFIKVKIEIATRNIKIEIQNSGYLNPKNQDPGIGLKNLKERLFLQYGDDASFEIKNLGNEIVVSNLLIPVA